MSDVIEILFDIESTDVEMEIDVAETDIQLEVNVEGLIVNVITDVAIEFPFTNATEVECLHNKGRVVDVMIYKDGTEVVYGEIDADSINPLNKTIVKFNQPLSGIIVIK